MGVSHSNGCAKNNEEGVVSDFKRSDEMWRVDADRVIKDLKKRYVEIWKKVGEGKRVSLSEYTELCYWDEYPCSSQDVHLIMRDSRGRVDDWGELGDVSSRKFDHEFMSAVDWVLEVNFDRGEDGEWYDGLVKEVSPWVFELSCQFRLSLENGRVLQEVEDADLYLY